jgi:hypothetical protein
MQRKAIDSANQPLKDYADAQSRGDTAWIAQAE